MLISDRDNDVLVHLTQPINDLHRTFMHT